MMKAVEKLITGFNCGKKYVQCGNHHMTSNNGVTRFFYHETAICTLNHGKVSYDNGGWNTSSTTRAINDYVRYFGVDESLC